MAQQAGTYYGLFQLQLVVTTECRMFNYSQFILESQAGILNWEQISDCE